MHESFTFHAKSTSQVLSFLSNGTPVGLPPIAVLDGVSVAAVPEPAMWGLMLVGFGLVGTAVRRRRPSAVLA
ncbi:PEPxxWA-CTERM sorting domain-containing protein [Polymorphobacter megasporae]|nr:PEPxxWA-CTERM sorting domain-containing protein [Polymorphobacter sp. PAMC 29334]UAJ11849.1 PEPxxWA-CTERM sorting domain-containing protein [Polymorphobacter megasporae]